MSVESHVILCVDDDPDALAIIRLSLELDPCFRIHCARSGGEAIQFLRDGLTPDLVLVDANMPGLSGPELAIAVQMIDRDRPPVIVFLTAAMRPKQLEDYYAAGAAGVISKPFNPLSLAGEIRQYLEKTALS